MIFESIAAVTAGTVTEENPLYGEVGVTVCAEVVGVIVWVVKDAGVNDPLTPKIDTPDLIFPAAMFESMDAVTGLTITCPNPSYPESGVIV